MGGSDGSGYGRYTSSSARQWSPGFSLLPIVGVYVLTFVVAGGAALWLARRLNQSPNQNVAVS